MGSKLNKKIYLQRVLIKEKHSNCFSQSALSLTLSSSMPSFEEVVVVRKSWFTFEQKYMFLQKILTKQKNLGQEESKCRKPAW